MTTVLAIDTSGPVIGVALSAKGRVYERQERLTRRAETRLNPWARSLLDEAGLPDFSSLDGIAVVRGPGAFTGLRVGLSMALGMGVALNCPIYSVDSLTVRAGLVQSPRVLALLDARRARVYAARFVNGARLNIGDVSPEEAVAWFAGESFTAVGEGAIVYESVIRSGGGQICEDPGQSAAAVLARMGAVAITSGLGQPAQLIRPLYLRDADAKPPRDLLIKKN